MTIKNRKYRPHRNLLTRDEARAILEPHVPALLECLAAAWEAVQQTLDDDPERRAVLDSSTQASMLYNWFAYLIVARLDGVPGVRKVQTGRMIKFVFNEQLSLRFKKFDRNLWSRNVRTNNQLRHYFQLQLDGVAEDATEVTLGYVTDVTNSGLRGVYLTCPIGWSRNKWMIVLDEADSGSFLFAPSESTPPTTVKPKVAIKKKA